VEGDDSTGPLGLDVPSRGTAKRRAVVAEDEPGIRSLIVSLLTLDGWEVHVTDTGENVADLLDEHNAVLCLLDVMMPGMDGVEAMAEGRRRGHGPEDGTVYVILTALGGPDDVMRGVISGADDYITKPFDVDDLSDRVTRWCNATGWELVDADHPGRVHEHLRY
jgi:two-component system KDP operon response regulator KdpE